MQHLILFSFALCFAAGLYLIAAELLHIPTYRTSRAIVKKIKKNRKQVYSLEAAILEVSVRLAKILPVHEYKKRKLEAVLKSAERSVTAEVYLAQAIVKASLRFLCAIPCLLVLPLAAPAFIMLGIAVYFKESTSAETMITERRQEIEHELPRFVSTLTQEMKASRDVLSMLETYQKNAGNALKHELFITTTDMRTGNYENALSRLEGRVSSAMLSDVVRGLIGTLRGDDGVAFFTMLSHDMKQIELQRLKKLAFERPPNIRKYSFLLLACMILLYMGVVGYQIAGTMSGMF